MATALDQLIQAQFGGGGSAPMPMQTPINAPPVAPPPPPVAAAPTGMNPFTDQRFLFDLGARLLAPRDPAQGQLGFAAGALNEAMGALSARKAAEGAAALEGKKVDIQQQGVDVEKRKAETSDKLAESTISGQPFINELRQSQSAESKARAAKLYAEAKNEATTGGKSAAAEVQVLNFITDSLMKINPKLYSGPGGREQAQLDAFTLKEQGGTNPSLWLANATEKYLNGEGALASQEEFQRNMTTLVKLKEMLTQALPSTQRPVTAAGAVTGDTSAGVAGEDNRVIPPGRLFAGLTISGAKKQLELFQKYPQTMINYVMGLTQDVNQQQAYMQELQQLLQQLPRRP